MTDLLERASALATLDDALAAAAHAGRVVLLGGEAGVGKSSLVRALAERHERAARVLVGACDPLLTPRALGPLHDVARDVGGDLAALLAEGATRERVFAAVLDELDRPGPPTVLVVEDAHWADEATLDLLLFLARRVDRVRAVLLVTYRDDEVGPQHPLQSLLGRVPRDAVTRVHLDPLSAAAVGELARRAGRDARDLHALTGGNPLLVTEVLAAGDAGVPMTVRDLVLARLAALPEDAQDAVRLCAVVPTRAEVWLLERALGADAGAVEKGIAVGLLVAEPDAVRFRHELLRRAVEDALSPLVRRDLNRRVLDALAAAPDRDVDVARLVHHSREAQDVEAVLRHAPVAARRAAAVGSHREAIGHFKVVLEHADRFPPDERAALLEELSIECYLTGRSTEAVAARREAVALRKTLGDPEALGAGLRWLSRMHWWDGDRPAAEAAAERAIEVLEALGPSRELGMAYSNRSQLDMLAHRHASAVEWAHRAIAMAERFDDPAVASLDEAGAAALRAEMLDIARRFDVSDDDTLVLRMDYLEVVVHKDEA